jgi:chemotaxis protein CheY-P-specific phosphatase CheC
MSNQETGILERLAAASLENCLQRVTKVSGAVWQLAGIDISRGTLASAVKLHDFSKDPSAAVVYINVTGGLPFTSLLFFNAGDVPHISKCFLEESLAQASGIPQFDEVMLLELGNIMLNAVINYLQNALKKSAIPSVPMLLKGDCGHIAEGLGVYLDPRQSFRIVTSSITVRRDSRVSRGEVQAIISEELAAALERA